MELILLKMKPFRSSPALLQGCCRHRAGSLASAVTGGLLSPGRRTNSRPASSLRLAWSLFFWVM